MWNGLGVMCNPSYRCCHCKLILSKGDLGHSFGTCTEAKPCGSFASMNRQRLFLWLWWCVCNLFRFYWQAWYQRYQEDDQGTTIRFPPGVCTLCLYTRGGAQGCNQDLHCPYPSQGLSVQFSEKKISLSQTQVSGFKYKSTKEGSWVK